MERKEIIAGITEDNEIYLIEIEPKSPDHDYFAMSADTVSPVTLKEAKNEARDTWVSLFQDDPDQLRDMNERMGTHFKTPESGAKYVLQVNGELHGFDNSTLTDEIHHKGKDWLFRAGSGGQHQERRLKTYFISPDLFKKLMNIWDKYHLKKENPPDMPEIPDQDREKLLKKAIDIIRKPISGHLE